MTFRSDDERSTADAMHDTAQELERSEARLHASAERSPDAGTTRRLHALGDAITHRAEDIERRADSLTPAHDDAPARH